MAGATEAIEAFLIPTVTPDDLLRFHHHHFGSTFTGHSIAATSSHEHRNEANFEDANESDLGYYPDGAPRTLTDEQIAIFRHSEIQRLLLKQLRDAETAADLAEFDESSESQAEAAENLTSVRSVTEKSTSKIPKKRKKQFAANSEKTRNQNRQKQYQETEDWRVSTRRRVRELDEISQQGDVVLDY